MDAPTFTIGDRVAVRESIGDYYETAEIVSTYNPACEYILILIDPGDSDQSYTYKVAYAS
jgi:hypothetical protein